MRVLVIGSGGREHAVCWKLSQSPLLGELYCAPGNPGIATVADRVPIEVENVPELVEFASEMKIDLTVVGHTDHVGTEEYNLALSLRRAKAVVDYLEANGLGHVSFTQHGKGESRPVADNETAEGRALNRRVEIYTHSPEEHCCSSIQEPTNSGVALVTRPSSGWNVNGG